MEYQYCDILKEPPDLEELNKLAALANIDVKDLINPKSKVFKDTGASLENITSTEAAKIIIDNPRTMYRPLLTDGKALVVGFKPEEMESLL